MFFEQVEHANDAVNLVATYMSEVNLDDSVFRILERAEEIVSDQGSFRNSTELISENSDHCPSQSSKGSDGPPQKPPENCEIHPDHWLTDEEWAVLKHMREAVPIQKKSYIQPIFVNKNPVFFQKIAKMCFAFFKIIHKISKLYYDYFRWLMRVLV